MYLEKRVSVVVPAHNESHQIGRVLTTMPPFVDEVLLVDDGSTDDTVLAALAVRDQLRAELLLLRHKTNLGVGAAIRTGYSTALLRGADVVAVMAGDGQMDPLDLERLITPVIHGEADYAKGDRLSARTKPPQMPLVRYLGVTVLTRLTRVATGYHTLGDSQSGYTAISSDCLARLPLSQLYPRYGYPNHLLIILGAEGQRVVDVPVRPVYGVGEVSGLRCWQVAPKLALLLGRGWLWRRRHHASSSPPSHPSALATHRP